MTADTPPRLRIRQACVAGIACLLSLVGIAALLAGVSSVAAAWPLLLAISAVVAVIGASLHPLGTPRALLLGFTAAMVAVFAILGYAVTRL